MVSDACPLIEEDACVQPRQRERGERERDAREKEREREEAPLALDTPPPPRHWVYAVGCDQAALQPRCSHRGLNKAQEGALRFALTRIGGMLQGAGAHLHASPFSAIPSTCAPRFHQKRVLNPSPCSLQPRPLILHITPSVSAEPAGRPLAPVTE